MKHNRSYKAIKGSPPEIAVISESGVGVFLPPEHGSLVISAIMQYSPAAKTGLKPGDTIVGVSGKSVGTFDEFIAVVGHLGKKRGRFNVRRRSKKVSFSLSLGPLLLFGKGDFRVSLDAKCNAKCKCVSSSVHIVCTESYYPTGRMINGFPEFTHSCTEIGRGQFGMFERTECEKVVLV